MGHKLQSSVLTSSLYYEKPNMPMIDPDEQLRCYIIDLSQYCEVPNMPMIYMDKLKHWKLNHHGLQTISSIEKSR